MSSPCPFCKAPPFASALGLSKHLLYDYPNETCIGRFGVRTARQVQTRSPPRAAPDAALPREEGGIGGDHQADDEAAEGEEEDGTTVESLDAILVQFAVLCNNGRGLNDTDRAKLIRLAKILSDASERSSLRHTWMICHLVAAS